MGASGYRARDIVHSSMLPFLFDILSILKGEALDRKILVKGSFQIGAFREYLCTSTLYNSIPPSVNLP